jgi:hypothetical protein
MTKKITDEEIQSLFNKLKKEYDNNLAKQGVKFFNLYRGDDYSKNALVLIYLYKNFKKKVSKQELISFLSKMDNPSEDVQQARHLAQQKGWYIISGQRGDIGKDKYNLKSGDYALISTKEKYPSYKPKKRDLTLNKDTWEKIKKEYNYRCATCGSKEGEANLRYPSSKTKLTQGHMDPNKELTYKNTIPQCNMCNRPSRNYFVFDKRGRVDKIADPKFIMRSDKPIQIKSMENLIKKYPTQAENLIKKIEE